MRYIATLLLTYSITLASDWPNWRGPAHTGISAEPVPKADLSKIAWRAKIGVGFSSMAVAEGRGRARARARRQDCVLFAQDGVRTGACTVNGIQI